MPRGWRPCPKPYCPEPTPPSQRYCDAHMVEYEAQRGTTTQRGYGSTHQSERKRWARRVATGIVACARCGRNIQPDTEWHLDHNASRSGYLGPSHAECNLRAAGQASHLNDDVPPF